MKKWTDEELIRIVKEWCEKNGRPPYVENFANNPSLPDPTTYTRRFNTTWTGALTKILGFKVTNQREKRLTEEQLIEVFKKEYERIQPKNKEEFDQKRDRGIPNTGNISKVYGLTYNQLKEKAGISILNKRRTKKEWEDILKGIVEKLGYVPSTRELEHRFGIYKKSFMPFLGEYNEAIEKLGFTPTNRSPVFVQETKQELLDLYINFCKKLNKLASSKDLDNCEEIYSSDVFILRFGSMYDLKIMANKVLNFNESIYTKRMFTKEELIKMLKKAMDEKGRRLTNKEVKENKDLPSVSTFLRYFRTTKMSDLWKEIERDY